MDDEDGALEAIAELNGHDLHGRKMKVRYLFNFLDEIRTVPRISVADPDPRSVIQCFLTPGSGTSISDHISESLVTFGFKLLKFTILRIRSLVPVPF